jgi:hypothetical protein
LRSWATLGLSGLANSDVILSLNALPKISLESSAGWIENKLRGEVGSDWPRLLRLGLFGRVEGNGGLVQGEAVDLRVKVEAASWDRCGRGRSLGGGTAGWLSRTSGGSCDLSGLLVSGNVEKVIES